MKYISSINTAFGAIFMNEKDIKPRLHLEKAAIVYTATVIRNENDWNGEAKSDRNNLACKTIAELGLDYRCADQRLGFFG